QTRASSGVGLTRTILSSHGRSFVGCKQALFVLFVYPGSGVDDACITCIKDSRRDQEAAERVPKSSKRSHRAEPRGSTISSFLRTHFLQPRWNILIRSCTHEHPPWFFTQVHNHEWACTRRM
ncbi:unnamed protein product, partial [Ectocarpus sp. 12 AP-2014]